MDGREEAPADAAVTTQSSGLANMYVQCTAYLSPFKVIPETRKDKMDSA